MWKHNFLLLRIRLEEIRTEFCKIGRTRKWFLSVWVFAPASTKRLGTGFSLPPTPRASPLIKLHPDAVAAHTPQCANYCLMRDGKIASIKGAESVAHRRVSARPDTSL
jgi:hypothetical protein